jgi:hypothetical protein
MNAILDYVLLLCLAAGGMFLAGRVFGLSLMAALP